MSSVETASLETDDFASQLNRLTSIFGDPTRREIYFFIKNNPDTTANALSAAFKIHANVARHHLERLVGAGYVIKEASKGSGVGRPARTYRVTDVPVELTGAMKRDALLVKLLERAMSLLGPERAESMALEVGQEYGRELASGLSDADAHASVHSALAAVADALTAHGFSSRTEGAEGSMSLVSSTCPFGDAAKHHPMLCAVDRGLVSGMLEGLGNGAAAVTISSKARGDDQCRTAV